MLEAHVLHQRRRRGLCPVLGGEQLGGEDEVVQLGRAVDGAHRAVSDGDDEGDDELEHAQQLLEAQLVVELLDNGLQHGGWQQRLRHAHAQLHEAARRLRLAGVLEVARVHRNGPLSGKHRVDEALLDLGQVELQLAAAAVGEGLAGKDLQQRQQMALARVADDVVAHHLGRRQVGDGWDRAALLLCFYAAARLAQAVEDAVVAVLQQRNHLDRAGAVHVHL
mmetsp:Transcript_21494/g.83368  ORF Transcript_21494/g.83368 Transcript_21494/m.83368 type:complete len:222 (+) Transcript_21494:365-1030(+)